MPELSVVIPIMNEEDNVQPMIEAVRDALHGFDYELIFVDDGSTDATHALINQLSQSDPLVRSLSFIRNFGKEPALFAGLEAELPAGVGIAYDGLKLRF